MSPALLVLLAALADESAGAQAFKKLVAQVGTWQGAVQWSGARTDSATMTVKYSLTGNGSALVEDLIADGKVMMTSVYHLDGPDLRVTHYCAAQNQPRLKATRIDLVRGVIDFDFVDATNLKPGGGHVHGVEIRLLGPDHSILTFLFQAGDLQSRERIDLKRVSA
jgi:hypothetical protein